MSRIRKLFETKKTRVLNIYCTAGYPQIDSLPRILQALENNGADLIEIGMPYSDPLADGPVIQHSSAVALANGMSMPVLFDQLKDVRKSINLPLLLMGYMNPVLQYGFERFCHDAASAGIDGLILPDLPMFEFETEYAATIRKYGLDFIFLVTPETSAERIKRLDSLTDGFLYAVSSSSTTGGDRNMREVTEYLDKLRGMKLKNPVLVGFGIRDRQSFNEASQHANGAIIGSAFIKALETNPSVEEAVKEFMDGILM